MAAHTIWRQGAKAEPPPPVPSHGREAMVSVASWLAREAVEGCGPLPHPRTGVEEFVAPSGLKISFSADMLEPRYKTAGPRGESLDTVRPLHAPVRMAPHNGLRSRSSARRKEALERIRASRNKEFARSALHRTLPGHARGGHPQERALPEPKALEVGHIYLQAALHRPSTVASLPPLEGGSAVTFSVFPPTRPSNPSEARVLTALLNRFMDADGDDTVLGYDGTFAIPDADTTAKHLVQADAVFLEAARQSFIACAEVGELLGRLFNDYQQPFGSSGARVAATSHLEASEAELWETSLCLDRYVTDLQALGASTRTSKRAAVRRRYSAALGKFQQSGHMDEKWLRKVATGISVLAADRRVAAVRSLLCSDAVAPDERLAVIATAIGALPTPMRCVLLHSKAGEVSPFDVHRICSAGVGRSGGWAAFFERVLAASNTNADAEMRALSVAALRAWTAAPTARTAARHAQTIWLALSAAERSELCIALGTQLRGAELVVLSAQLEDARKLADPETVDPVLAALEEEKQTMDSARAARWDGRRDAEVQTEAYLGALSIESQVTNAHAAAALETLREERALDSPPVVDVGGGQSDAAVTAADAPPGDFPGGVAGEGAARVEAQSGEVELRATATALADSRPATMMTRAVNSLKAPTKGIAIWDDEDSFCKAKGLGRSAGFAGGVGTRAWARWVLVAQGKTRVLPVEEVLKAVGRVYRQRLEVGMRHATTTRADWLTPATCPSAPTCAPRFFCSTSPRPPPWPRQRRPCRLGALPYPSKSFSTCR